MKNHILVSDRLKEVLTEFENESLVARLLLGKETAELADDFINYIGVSEQDMTKISYLSNDRIEKINKQFSPEAGYSSLMTERALWASPIRFHARPGSVISKMFKNIPPKEVEKFSNLYRANVNKPKFTFKVVSGESIRRYYHYETYGGEGRGTLGNSCMKHEGCQKYLNLYTEHPSLVSMLCMFNDEGLLTGRALLWNWDSYKIMDRIYTICDEELAFYFKKWATDNGYLYKSEQNWFNTLQFESLNNKKQELKLDIKLTNIDYRYYPYVDTFKWLNMESGTIHNYIPTANDNRNVKTLAASDGGRLEWDYIILDGLDNVHRYRNECGFVEYKNLWTHQGNLNFSDINNKWILCKDAIFDEDLGDYIFNSEYDSFNDKPLIEKRRSDIKERRERRKIEDKRRAIERELMAYVHNPDFSDILSLIGEIGQEEALNRINQRIAERRSQTTTQDTVENTQQVTRRSRSRGEIDRWFDSLGIDLGGSDILDQLAQLGIDTGSLIPSYRVSHSEPTTDELPDEVEPTT